MPDARSGLSMRPPNLAALGTRADWHRSQAGPAKRPPDQANIRREINEIAARRRITGIGLHPQRIYSGPVASSRLWRLSPSSPHLPRPFEDRRSEHPVAPSEISGIRSSLRFSPSDPLNGPTVLASGEVCRAQASTIPIAPAADPVFYRTDHRGVEIMVVAGAQLTDHCKPRRPQSRNRICARPRP